MRTALTCDRRHILGMRVDATSYREVCGLVMNWGRRGESRYICVATVNNVMESHDSAHVMKVMNEADVVTPDGMPLVWCLRMLGIRSASRVYGPDLTPLVLQAAADGGLPVGFYGSSQNVLRRLVQMATERFDNLRVAYSYSPPYRPLTEAEDLQVCEDIRRSGCRVLFIGLNSPKQDEWMHTHRGQLPVVMIGVGAAFNFLSGTMPQAPRWMMSAGLEWLFRLITEPGRLWRRYLKQNPRFLYLMSLQLVKTHGVQFLRRTHLQAGRTSSQGKAK